VLATREAVSARAPGRNPESLESLLGDPHDGGNPCRFAEVLAADERGELLRAGEAALERWQLNAEFVPVDLGGRLGAAFSLMRRSRALFRRDAALGLGYGVTSLMAAVNIWAGGSPEQRRRAAQILLSGQRIAIGYHELEHGNDLLRNEFAARRSGQGYVLEGTKQVINNVERAAALVLFARTSDQAGGRSHSVFFLEKEQISPQSVRYLPRYRTVGVRGCLLGGIQIKGLKASGDRIIGEPGTGAELALRSFQLTRTVLPGMAVGSLDTALRCALEFAEGRFLYRTTVSELPHARSILVYAFTDLLIADCLASTVALGLQWLPAQASAQAAAVKYLVSLLIEDSMADLSIVLGARSYLRAGHYAIFGKHQRDVPALSLGHAGGVACLLFIISQLQLMSRFQERRSGPAAYLFEHRQPQQECMQFDALTLRVMEGDSILAGLSIAGERIEAECDEERAALSLIEDFKLLEASFWQECRGIPPAERSVKASGATFALASRYSVLLAAGACVGVWRAERSRGTPFLGEPFWIQAALGRLRQRFSGERVVSPVGVREALFRELRARGQARMTFDLEKATIAGG
jgi:alkylation response protein AidB-like acyl-CoA dehydrogenase